MRAPNPAVALATATLMGSDTVPVATPSVARMTAVPAVSDVITPLASTDAIKGVSDVHVTVPVIVLPTASRNDGNT